jgi:phosphoribosylformylglycinamidine synthase
VEVWRDARLQFAGAARRPAAAPGTEVELAHRSACATTRPAPTHGARCRAPTDAAAPGLRRCSASTRREDIAGAVHRQRSPAEGGHPARAGRELAARDGLRPSTAAGFDAFDVHMSDLQAGARAPARTSRAWWPAAASATATCWAPAKAGPAVHPASTRARGPIVRGLLRPQRHLRPGRVGNGCQMMASSGGADPRRRGTGRASPATAASSSRPACRWWRCWKSPSLFFAGHGRQPPADCGGARRGAAPTFRSGGERRARVRAMRYVDGHGRPPRPIPANPNGSSAGTRR